MGGKQDAYPTSKAEPGSDVHRRGRRCRICPPPFPIPTLAGTLPMQNNSLTLSPRSLLWVALSFVTTLGQIDLAAADDQVLDQFEEAVIRL